VHVFEIFQKWSLKTTLDPDMVNCVLALLDIAHAINIPWLAEQNLEPPFADPYQPTRQQILNLGQYHP
jgi:hypothetical protein